MASVESHTPSPPVVIGEVVIREVPNAEMNQIRPRRLHSMDLLRGIVVVLMALDHARDFLSGLPFAPEDLSRTTGPLFFTRFVTHFCAPVFFLLAGAGGSLSLSHGKSPARVSRFFWTRGLWLVFLDLTIISYGWTYVFPYWFGGVLWALGWSMVAMSLVMRLPLRWVAALGAGMIVTHNLLDSVDPTVFGKFARLWVILHGHGTIWIEPGKTSFFVLFPLIPWVGVMALGYALGALLRREGWQKLVWRTGAVLTICFFVLRILHLYGNSQPQWQLWAPDASGPWQLQGRLTLTLVSFFDTSKYPPSLQFLLMTLGPSLMALAWLDRVNAERWPARVLLTFGRVPLFYYVLHLYLIHTMAVWIALVFHQHAAWLLYGGPMLLESPEGYGHGLPFIYAMWAVVVTMLYFPCRWFMKFKEQHADWNWLRYL